MHEPSVRMLPVQGTPEDPEPNLDRRHTARKRTWPLITVVAASVAVLASGLTYATIVNDWMPSVTGLFYTESEHEAGLQASYDEGEDAGHEAGFEEGEAVGFADGEDAGFEAGHATGTKEGYDAGSKSGFDDGYVVGYADGQDGGWDAGYGSGYLEGWSDGCLFLFNGLGTERVGDWWDYYYSSYYGSYYTKTACS